MTNTNTIYHHEDFIENKYHRWYFNIINKARDADRVKGSGVYYEKHHIVPKSMDGSNDPLNLILLTAKEHYIVHLILPKIVTQSSVSYHKLVYAYNSFAMVGGFRYTSRLYQRFKENFCSNLGGKNHHRYGSKHSKQTIKKMSGVNNHNYGTKFSKETRTKMSVSRSGTNSYRFKGYYLTP